MVEFYSNLPLIVQAIAKALAVIVVLMSLCAYSVLAERKISAWIQGRPGPNRTSLPIIKAIPIIGPFITRLGLIQPAADGLKFLFKEDPIPGHVNKFYYVLAPILALIPALTTVVVVPFGEYINAAGQAVPLILANVDVGILLLFAISSLGVYAIIIAGWAANSKYPFLGGVRASAQLISYELAMGLSVLPVFLWINTPGSEGTLSLFSVVQAQQGLWFGIWMPVSAMTFLIALFAETNRLPFDMPESEADLVGGFHTEYGAFKFGLFFVAEYAHMLVGSAVVVLLFLGGWNPLPWVPIERLFTWCGITNPFVEGLISVLIFLGKLFFFLFLFIWVRWTVPRFRYDQVMRIGWRVMLPIAIANLLFYTLLFAVIQK